jgi:hypothetical protein
MIFLSVHCCPFPLLSLWCLIFITVVLTHPSCVVNIENSAHNCQKNAPNKFEDVPGGKEKRYNKESSRHPYIDETLYGH